MITKDELHKTLAQKAFGRPPTGNKSVIFRLPDALYEELQEYHRSYMNENHVTLSLNKLVVDLITKAIK